MTPDPDSSVLQGAPLRREVLYLVASFNYEPNERGYKLTFIDRRKEPEHLLAQG